MLKWKSQYIRNYYWIILVCRYCLWWHSKFQCHGPFSINFLNSSLRSPMWVIRWSRTTNGKGYRTSLMYSATPTTWTQPPNWPVLTTHPKLQTPTTTIRTSVRTTNWTSIRWCLLKCSKTSTTNKWWTYKSHWSFSRIPQGSPII